MSGGVYVQMDGNPPLSQIGYSQHTGYDIPAHVVEDQHLEYRFAGLGEEGRVRGSRIVSIGGWFGRV